MVLNHILHLGLIRVAQLSIRNYSVGVKSTIDNALDLGRWEIAVSTLHSQVACALIQSDFQLQIGAHQTDEVWISHTRFSIQYDTFVQGRLFNLTLRFSDRWT